MERGVAEGKFEIASSVARLPQWRPAFDARTSDLRETLTRRLGQARWQVPTVEELEREFPGAPVRAVLSHLAREGAAEPIDQQRYAAKAALAEFRAALEAALVELNAATPADLRDRFGLTRQYLIPLLYCPNPFNPATTVPFTLSGDLFVNGHRPKVSLKIYNVLAQLVAVPILQGTGERVEDVELACSSPQGCSFSCYWDGTVLNTGQPAAPGVYIYRLFAVGERYAKKMIVLQWAVYVTYARARRSGRCPRS